jgi:hypothetical protein
MGGTTSSAIQIMSPEVRAHTPVHIPARSAYRGARRDERKRLRTRMPAEMCVCVRRRCEFDVWRPRDVWPLLPTREGVRSRAYGPAHHMDGSRPHRRARRTFPPNGKSDDACQGAPAHVPAHTCAGLSCECNTLTRFCARDAQTTPRSSTPPPPSSSPVSVLRSPLPPRRLPLPRRCRSNA